MLKNQHKPGTLSSWAKGRNYLGYQCLVFWSTRTNPRLLRSIPDFRDSLASMVGRTFERKPKLIIPTVRSDHFLFIYLFKSSDQVTRNIRRHLRSTTFTGCLNDSLPHVPNREIPSTCHNSGVPGESIDYKLSARSVPLLCHPAWRHMLMHSLFASDGSLAYLEHQSSFSTLASFSSRFFNPLMGKYGSLSL